MSDNTNRQPNIEAVRELLSPYLDGEVTDEEKTMVEQAIAFSPDLNQELESLRQVVTQVSALPRMPAPRPFTLSEADIRAKPSVIHRFLKLPLWLGGFAAAAATLLLVIGLGWAIMRQQSNEAPASIAYEAAAPAAEEAPDQGDMAMESAAIEEEAASGETTAESELALQSTEAPSPTPEVMAAQEAAEAEVTGGEEESESTLMMEAPASEPEVSQESSEAEASTAAADEAMSAEADALTPTTAVAEVSEDESEEETEDQAASAAMASEEAGSVPAEAADAAREAPPAGAANDEAPPFAGEEGAEENQADESVGAAAPAEEATTAKIQPATSTPGLTALPTPPPQATALVDTFEITATPTGETEAVITSPVSPPTTPDLTEAERSRRLMLLNGALVLLILGAIFVWVVVRNKNR